METRAHIRTLQANGAYGSKDVAKFAAQEAKYEVEGGIFGYTRTDHLNDIMDMVNTPEIRVEFEHQIETAVDLTIGRNDGSAMRAYIAKDGWTAQEVDQFDARWVDNNAYAPATYEVDENGRVVLDKDGNPVIKDMGDQKHRNEVIERLIFTYDDDEALHTGLRVIDTANFNSETVHSADYLAFAERCETENASHGYKAQFKGQDDVQTYLAGRSTEDGTINDEDEVGSITAKNTLLFDRTKPARVIAEEALYNAKAGDASQLFETTNAEVYNAVNEILADDKVAGASNVNELYRTALAQTKGTEKVSLRANAALSGQVEFTDEELVNLCIELMHDSDKNHGLGASSGASAKHTNISEERKLQLQALLLEHPELREQIKAKIEEGSFKYTYSITTGGGGSVPPTTHNYTVETKDDYLAMLNDSDQVVDESVFLDENGNEITDPEKLAELKANNDAALNNLRAYVAELERAYKMGVDEEGWLSDMANGVSRYSGIGTDRGDVENAYREATILLRRFEAAAEGKLRDKDGNVISTKDLAEEVIAKEQGLQEVNANYEQTIATGKMVIIMAPVIVGTIAISGGAATAGWAGAGATVTIGGGITMSGATATGIVTGTFAGGMTYGLHRLDQVTSYTGNTGAAREAAAEEGLKTGFMTGVPVGVALRYSAPMAYGGTTAQKLAATAIDTGAGLGTVGTVNFAETGEFYVTGGDLAFTLGMSGLGHFLFTPGAKSTGGKTGAGKGAGKGPVDATGETGVGKGAGKGPVDATGETGAGKGAGKGPVDATGETGTGKGTGETGAGKGTGETGTGKGTGDATGETVLSKATKEGTAPSGGKLNPQKQQQSIAETRQIAQDGSVDDIVAQQQAINQHGQASRSQARPQTQAIADEVGFVQVGKKRIDIKTANMEDLLLAQKALKNRSNLTPQQRQMLNEIDNRIAQLKGTVPPSTGEQAPVIPVESAPVSQGSTAFDDAFKNSGFNRNATYTPGQKRPIDPLGRGKFEQYKRELQNLCDNATTEAQLATLEQKVELFSSDPQRKAFQEIIAARKAQIKAQPTPVGPKAEVETPVTPAETKASGSPEYARSTQVVDALNDLDAYNATQILNGKKGAIGPHDAAMLESHLMNNLTTVDDVETFIAQIRNKVGVDGKGRMHVYEVQGTDHAAALVRKAQQQISTINAKNAAFQDVRTHLANAQGRGLSGDEFTAIKNYIQKTNSVEELKTIQQGIGQTKASSSKRSLNKQITEKIEMLETKAAAAANQGASTKGAASLADDVAPEEVVVSLADDVTPENVVVSLADDLDTPLINMVDDAMPTSFLKSNSAKDVMAQLDNLGIKYGFTSTGIKYTKNGVSYQIDFDVKGNILSTRIHNYQTGQKTYFGYDKNGAEFPITRDDYMNLGNNIKAQKLALIDGEVHTATAQDLKKIQNLSNQVDDAMTFSELDNLEKTLASIPDCPEKTALTRDIALRRADIRYALEHGASSPLPQKKNFREKLKDFFLGGDD